MSVWVSVRGLCVSSVCVCVCACVFVVQVHLNGRVFTTKLMQFSDPFNCPSDCLNLDRANQSNKMEEAGKKHIKPYSNYTHA